MKKSLQTLVAFTLIELLTVVLIILVLAAMSLRVSSYVQKRMAISSTKGQIAAMETALESYKSDWGYYPLTTAIRLSATGFWQATNNWIMYRALSGANGGKVYMTFPASQLRMNTAAISNSLTAAINPNGGLTNICDAWGTPYIYYCSPSTIFSNVQPCVGANAKDIGYVLGGQVNAASFDLCSFGPDHFTYISGGKYFISGACGGFNIYPWYNTAWTNVAAGADDITNY